MLWKAISSREEENLYISEASKLDDDEEEAHYKSKALNGPKTAIKRSEGEGRPSRSGVNFTNIFTYSFYARSSQKCKNSVKLLVSFYAFGIYWSKSCLVDPKSCP